MKATALRFFVLLGCMLGLAGALRAADAAKLNLVFTGSGTVLSSQTSFENKYNWKTKKYESGTSTANVRRPFTGSGFVEISGAMGRIKLPSAMIPLMNSGREGWFAVADFFMNESEITGVVRINALNKPKLSIDRNSGIITLAGGLGDFTGQCELASTAPEKRKF